MNKEEIAAAIFLIASIVVYIFGTIYDIRYLIDWAPEVGGASIVLLGYFLIEELWK